MNKILAVLLFFFSFCVKAQPVLKGGLENFVKTNTIYPAYSLQNCIQGNINISFKLNKEGVVYASRVSQGLGVDLDLEALRLIRMSSGKWKVPDDYDTAYVLIAPVSFKLSGADCTGKSQVEINKAIAAYQADQGLTDAVRNFYRNKAGGKYTDAEEAKIVALKKELGYDDAFLESKIKEGQQKLKQKDKQGACEDFLFVKQLGSPLADELIARYCK